MGGVKFFIFLIFNKLLTYINVTEGEEDDVL